MPTGIYIRTMQYKNNLKKAMNRPDVKNKISGKNHYAYNRLSEWKIGTSRISIHNWLRKIYGQANHCENNKCKKISKHFEWSLLKGKKYERKRKNFWQLCTSCHAMYDNKVKAFSASRLKPWNKNLTKEIDTRIKRYGVLSGKTRKGKGHVPKTAFRKGHHPWNYNLTKEIDIRLKKAGNAISITKLKTHNV